MIRKIGIFTLLVFCATISQTNAQDECVPLAVTNVGVSGDQVLYWQVPSEEACTIDHFIINIQFSWGDIEGTFVTTEPSLDVSSLPACEYWFFSVSAVSTEHVVGDVRNIFAQVPMPADTDLSVNVINITRAEDYIYLQWEVQNPDNAFCADYYRLTVVDESTNIVVDREVIGRFAYIRDLSPCSAYQFGVRAIHRARPEVEGRQTVIPYEEPGRRLLPPRLLNITRGTTFINTTWALEEYARNRCPVTAIFANGSPYFNLTIPVQDSPQRPPITINLSSLVANTMYIFRVSAENSAGQSPAIPVGVQTLPLQSEVSEVSELNEF